MNFNFRFAIVSDLHVALPHTVGNHPSRFHLVEVSIPALELIFKHLEQLNIDFLLLPGDLTQDGEPENHQWLQKRLKLLPFPVYVVPGNHDVPTLLQSDRSIGFKDFPFYYQQFGYKDPYQLYYSCEPLPGVQVIGLNSNQFDIEGKQLGCLDREQLIWLEKTLAQVNNKLVLITIHHNIIEHLPGQSTHELGRRYMLSNASTLLQILEKYGVKLVFTGHLHVQDVARHEKIYEITTGSVVSYPHPYRVLHLQSDSQGRTKLEIESHRVQGLPGWENLIDYSREWIGDRSFAFVLKLLTSPPLNLSLEKAQELLPRLRYFWADVAAGDAIFDLSDLGPEIRHFFHRYSAIDTDGNLALIDNRATIWL